MSFRNELREGVYLGDAVPYPSCYNPTLRRVQSPPYIMRFDLQDVALRTLILVAGGLAAVLLALKGQGQALPALAVGGTLGAFMMARFGPSEQ